MVIRFFERVFVKRCAALATLTILSGGLAVAPADTASAQGFLDRLFNTPRYQERQRLQRRDLRPENYKPIRVAGPRYYAYKADGPVRASFENLAEVDPISGVPSIPPRLLTPFERSRDHLKTFRLRTYREIASAVDAYYTENPRFLWIDRGAPTNRAHAVIAALGRADRFGLSPLDYQVALPDLDAGDGDPDAREAALIRFEMELTANALLYVLDAQRGRVDPNKISGYHDLPRNAVDLARTVRLLATVSRPDVYLEGRHPATDDFKALVKALAELKAQEEAEDIVEIQSGTFLKPGATNPELVNVIAAIRKSGSAELLANHAAYLDVYADEHDYTPEAVALVQDFQREKGLVADGIVGKNTIRALTPISSRQRIRKIELAMERRRWLPRNLGSRHVFINQAAFRATYIEAGAAPFSMRVVVGTKANQTSFFHDQIETVEYNPYWGVPRSIIVNEMVPKLYGDPSYLDRLGYEVTTVSGRRVSSSSVDWYGVATKQVSINVRQPPGSGNALGRLKILFPNKHAIYMHDTPHKSLFDKDMRAFSHGCIRLHDPRGMAAKVLGTSVDYIDRRIAEGHNDSDDVPRKIPVYVTYFTAWPTDEGTIGFHDDVYGRDAYLTKALEATDRARHPSS